VSYPIEIPTPPDTEPSPALLRPPCEPGRVHRTRLWESPIGLVEDLRSSMTLRNGSPEAYSPFFQICLPYRGLFVWHVGHDDVVADPNQVLFVAGGESFHLSQPIAGRYAELIITPDSDLLAELTQSSPLHLSGHPLFRRRSRRANLKLQGLRARFLHRALAGQWDDIAAEELLIDLLREALQPEPVRATPSPRTRRLVRSTKEFVHGRLSGPLRLRDVARAVGASPTYLTDVFRRVEGVPLHRYLMQLRLARALVELPHASDLTTLAFNLGFSSHSHFTAAFRRAFDCTPSQFRVLNRSNGSARYSRTGHAAAKKQSTHS
jgi:AraC family transcriptional regulator